MLYKIRQIGVFFVARIKKSCRLVRWERRLTNNVFGYNYHSNNALYGLVLYIASPFSWNRDQEQKREFVFNQLDAHIFSPTS